MTAEGDRGHEEVHSIVDAEGFEFSPVESPPLKGNVGKVTGDGHVNGARGEATNWGNPLYNTPWDDDTS